MELPENVGIALLLTVFAGLSTGIGSAIAYFIKKPKVVYLSFALGLSAGVALAAFFIGIAVIAVIDMLIPEPENPHHYEGLDEPTAPPHDSHLMRTGVLTALAIGIHNFPEGLATFASTLGDVKVGIFIAVAIAIHNVPEGIAVSVPIFYATGNKRKAFLYSFLSGLSEPIGAMVGLLILMPFLNDSVLAAVLAFVAGIMIYISLDELLPVAHRYGHGHLVIGGIVAGMLIMAISLLML
ncbi:MAG: zinc transporter ZupT [Planctomycetota bacterium]|jgi:ZIP family zinc transporter